MNLALVIQTIAIYGLPVVFAITVHEAAHGYAARHFGDPTATLMGRVTLNPVKHVDPIGTIAIPLFLYLATSGAFLFGYAKPVPVNFGKLRNPKRDMIWVALAGPASNLGMALGWALLQILFIGIGLTEPFFLEMCKAGVLINVVLMVLNLFPLPPLDGGRILVGLLPPRQAIAVSRIEPWGFFIVMGLIVTGILSQLWMWPLMRLTFILLDTVLWPFKALLLS